MFRHGIRQPMDPNWTQVFLVERYPLALLVASRTQSSRGASSEPSRRTTTGRYPNPACIPCFTSVFCFMRAVLLVSRRRIPRLPLGKEQETKLPYARYCPFLITQ